MVKKRKPQGNFICDPDTPSGLIFDTMLHDESIVPHLKIIDYPNDYIGENAEVINTIKRLKKNFTQFSEHVN